LGTKIVVMRNGEIVQMGNKNEIVFENKNNYVDDFIGNKGFLSYLNIVKIEKYMTPITENQNGKVLGLDVRKDDPLIVGIRMCLENGVRRICVRDDK